MKTVIISGGYIDDVFAVDWLQHNQYDLLIAADSGMDFLYRSEITPDVIAGDFDSVKEDAFEAFSKNTAVEMIRLNPIKDDTDTEYVIREAIRRGAREITLLGATGTRLDHVLANVHLLGIGLKEQVSICLLDAHNRIRLVENNYTLTKKEQFGDYVSFLPFAGCAKGVTLEGFKYPLKDATIEPFCSLGISNEIVAETAKVAITDGLLLMIESRD